MKRLFSIPSLPAITLGVGFLLAAPTALLAQATPIAGTGYNVDGLADSGATSAPATTTTIPGVTAGLDGQFAYIAQGFNGNTTNGIPVGNTTSYTFTSAGSTNEFAIQPATGNNVLLLAAGADVANTENVGSFTLTTAAQYSAVDFLVTGFNGNQTFSYSLNYSDGTSATGTGTAVDNFGNANGLVALNCMGRVNATDSGIDTNPNDPVLFEVDATANPAETLTSITVTGDGTTQALGGNAQTIGFFGFSGVAAVPEPSTWAMLLSGAGLLAFVQFRRRSVRA